MSFEHGLNKQRPCGKIRVQDVAQLVNEQAEDIQIAFVPLRVSGNNGMAGVDIDVLVVGVSKVRFWDRQPIHLHSQMVSIRIPAGVDGGHVFQVRCKRRGTKKLFIANVRPRVGQQPARGNFILCVSFQKVNTSLYGDTWDFREILDEDFVDDLVLFVSLVCGFADNGV